MMRDLTPPRGYSHAAQRGLPQVVPALSLGCHCSVFPPASWLGWTEVKGAGQRKTVREGINSYESPKEMPRSVSPNRGSTQGESMAPSVRAPWVETLRLEVKTEATPGNQETP